MKWTPRKIKALMKFAGYERQRDLADAAGVNEGTISRALSGRTARVSPMTAIQLDGVGEKTGFLPPPGQSYSPASDPGRPGPG